MTDALKVLFASAAAVLIVAAFMYWGYKIAHSADEAEAKIKIACIEAGGEWQQIEDGRRGDYGCRYVPAASLPR